MNAFRHTPNGSLDRPYLRVCAVYRLMRQRRIDKPRAIELLKARRVPHAQALVELWLAGALSEAGRLATARWRETMEASA